MFQILQLVKSLPLWNLSISIFRRLSLFPAPMDKVRFLREHFQSPFSGDFLCFVPRTLYIIAHAKVFQSPFSGDFLCFEIDSVKISEPKIINFQSPFSGDFLCFLVSRALLAAWLEGFQSPFSGDFLCFGASCEHTIAP